MTNETAGRRRFDGVIFDMDGVLCDSEAFICEAAVRMFRERHGVDVRPEDFVPFVGAGENRYLGGVAEKYGIAPDMEADKRRTYEVYLEIIRGHLQPLRGAREFVADCRRRGLRVAVATSADRIKLDGNLREIGIPAESFDALVDAGDVVRKKPDPEAFVLAAKRLGLSPRKCLVVEDAPNGIRAAKAAGSDCLGVTSSFPAALLAAAGADWTVPDLASVPDEVLGEAVAGESRREEGTPMTGQVKPEKTGAEPGGIVRMASAFYESALLFAACDLGVFATLADKGPCAVEAVAAACGLDRRGARLLLDGCAAIGLLVKEGAAYRNSEAASRFLVPGEPGDLSGAIRYNRDVYPLWGRLHEMARTGKPVERPETHLGRDEARTRTFVLAMHGRAMGIGRSVVPLLDLRTAKRVLDVGGGPGAYSMLIAKANPGARCTVLDLPGVVKVARELVEREGLGDRVATVAGDYHDAAFPPGNDAILFFGVLHQEPPETIKGLFRRAHEALAPGGVVYVMDMMTDASYTRPAFSALFAVNMALSTEHGWVFSDADLAAWLAEAGFSDFACRPLPPPMPHWLASARRT